MAVRTRLLGFRHAHLKSQCLSSLLISHHSSWEVRCCVLLNIPRPLDNSMRSSDGHLKQHVWEQLLSLRRWVEGGLQVHAGNSPTASSQAQSTATWQYIHKNTLLALQAGISRKGLWGNKKVNWLFLCSNSNFLSDVICLLKKKRNSVSCSSQWPWTYCIWRWPRILNPPA